jgi:hypothetical protein
MPIISNGVVSDRTCDLNYTTYVQELDSGNFTDRKLYIDKEGDKARMSAFDIGLYVLHPMTDIYTTDVYYNKSFAAVNT